MLLLLLVAVAVLAAVVVAVADVVAFRYEGNAHRHSDPIDGRPWVW